MDGQGNRAIFFAPNPGVLYPAVFDLAERVLAAAKSSRKFSQTRQEGWRCSLTGENEWLTTDREQLHWNQSYRQKQGTLWTKIALEKPSWAKEREHLSALPAIKRLWPTLFKEEVRRALAASDDGSMKQIDRFVVSTHTMALAHQLYQFTESGARIPEDLAKKIADKVRVALPARLAKNLRKTQHPQSELIGRIPGWLEDARESDKEDDLEVAQRQIKDLLGNKLETYYSLIMMDGDHMGAILAGDNSTGTAISYLRSFHPTVQKGFAERAAREPLLKEYGDQQRAITPNRHLAISGALNDFSQIVVRHVVEQERLGRVIYAGGDDVLAMLPVADLLSTMQRLRHAYSGTLPEDETLDWSELRKRSTLVCKGGFAWLDGRLMRMMGRNATASVGAVVAHHQAPLLAVLRELRSAEQRAKHEGGRDAFSITIIKRSGGALTLTERWGEPVNALVALRDFLKSESVSRRAVYHTLEWLNESELPVNCFESGMFQALLAYQLDRQAKNDARSQAATLAEQFARLASEWPSKVRIAKLRNFLAVAEFLARETRTGPES